MPAFFTESSTNPYPCLCPSQRRRETDAETVGRDCGLRQRRRYRREDDQECLPVGSLTCPGRGSLFFFVIISLCVCVCVCVGLGLCIFLVLLLSLSVCIFAQFILLTHAHRTLLLYNCNVSNSTPLNVFQSSKNFNLTLPSPSLHQAIFSSVLPGQLMRGGMGRPEFPRWLGNHSARGKNDRLLQELQRHTRLRWTAAPLLLWYTLLTLSTAEHRVTRQNSDWTTSPFFTHD